MEAADHLTDPDLLAKSTRLGGSSCGVDVVQLSLQLGLVQLCAFTTTSALRLRSFRGCFHTLLFDPFAVRLPLIMLLAVVAEPPLVLYFVIYCWQKSPPYMLLGT